MCVKDQNGCTNVPRYRLANNEYQVGGRDMDECLMRTFAATFKKKTGCDVLSNKKALVKLEDDFFLHLLQHRLCTT